MIKSLIIPLTFAVCFFGSALAQEMKQSSQTEYRESCNDSYSFKLNEKVLSKKDGVVYVKTKTRKHTFKDTLVEAEHTDMRKYEVVGVGREISKALVREVRLTETVFLLIDLKTGSIQHLDSAPIISSNFKYLTTVKAPESDNYKGLKVFELNSSKLKLRYKDTDNSYFFVLKSGKWCNNTFFVMRKDVKTLQEQYFKLNL